MPDETNKFNLVSLRESEQDQIARLEQKIVQLEEMVAQLNVRNLLLETQKAHLAARIRKLENPQESYYENIGWAGKIIFILKRNDVPMRAELIRRELSDMDISGSLKKLANPATYMRNIFCISITCDFFWTNEPTQWNNISACADIYIFISSGLSRRCSS